MPLASRLQPSKINHTQTPHKGITHNTTKITEVKLCEEKMNTLAQQHHSNTTTTTSSSVVVGGFHCRSHSRI
jgi:hypothetical protein